MACSISGALFENSLHPDNRAALPCPASARVETQAENSAARGVVIASRIAAHCFRLPAGSAARIQHDDALDSASLEHPVRLGCAAQW